MALPRIGKPAPIFKGKAVVNDKVFDISSSDYEDKYLILLFFPMDFTYVCRTELFAFSDKMEEFAKLNTSIVACTTETYLTHLKWFNIPQTEGGIHGVRIPLIADKSLTIARNFGVLDEDDGIAQRATFIIDDKGILRHVAINSRPVGRNILEYRQLIKLIQEESHSNKSRPEKMTRQFSISSLFKPRPLASLERALIRELTE